MSIYIISECIKYNCIKGGLKAVIYTDAMQALIMLVGLVVVCVIGSSQAGGSSEVFMTAKEIGRFNFNK